MMGKISMTKSEQNISSPIFLSPTLLFKELQPDLDRYANIWSINSIMLTFASSSFTAEFPLRAFISSQIRPNFRFTTENFFMFSARFWMIGYIDVRDGCWWPWDVGDNSCHQNMNVGTNISYQQTHHENRTLMTMQNWKIKIFYQFSSPKWRW